MKSAVIVFPGSNCDRDMAVALRQASGRAPAMIWHKEADLPAGLDLVALPGGFSFGDYLRCGAIGARSPVMRAVAAFAAGGGLILGVCNGFQVMLEAGLLPGALTRNATLKFVCRDVGLEVATAASPFTRGYGAGARIRLPIAHHDGAYVADEATLARLRDQDRIALRYVDGEGRATAAANPNGSVGNIAGVLSENRRGLGLMPHPERAADEALAGALAGALGRADGAPLFQGLLSAVAAA